MIGNLKTTLFYLFFISILGTSYGQTNDRLESADSLFMNQKYTEAFALYDEIFSSGQVSESMLLKMAFIKEGLGDYVQSLYYLDSYYNLTSDKSVLRKMQELASQNSLIGYELGDRDFLINFLKQYKLEIQILLIVISFFLLGFAYQTKKKNQMPIGVPILQLIIIVAFIVLSNNLFQDDKAIIQSPTLLMSGPSAGAEPVGWVNSGHRIEVIEKSEVWTKIKWEDGEAFIRNSKIDSPQ